MGRNVVNLVPGSKESDTRNWDVWHVPARDSQGHHSRVQVKVPPSMLAQCQQLMNEKVLPYRSIGYLFRHALLSHLKMIAEMPDVDPDVGSTVHAINAMVEIVREDEYMDDFRGLFDRLDDAVGRHRRRNNDARARQLVMKVWAQIRQMNDNFWREEYEKELKARYGNLLA